MGEVLGVGHPGGVMTLAALLAAEVLVLWRLGGLVSGRLFALSQRSPLHKLAVYPLLAPGVALHETAHAAAALGCGVGVTRFVPFWPVQEKGGGWRFGYVQHAPATMWQIAVIASAPLWLPSILLYLAGCAVVPGVELGAGPFALLAQAAEHASSPAVAAWWWVGLSSALSNFPSSVDIRNMAATLPVVGVIAGACFAAAGASAESVGLLAPFMALAAVLAPPAAVCVAWWAVLAARDR